MTCKENDQYHKLFELLVKRIDEHITRTYLSGEYVPVAFEHRDKYISDSLYGDVCRLLFDNHPAYKCNKCEKSITTLYDINFIDRYGKIYNPLIEILSVFSGKNLTHYIRKPDALSGKLSFNPFHEVIESQDFSTNHFRAFTGIGIKKHIYAPVSKTNDARYLVKQLKKAILIHREMTDSQRNYVEEYAHSRTESVKSAMDKYLIETNSFYYDLTGYLKGKALDIWVEAGIHRRKSPLNVDLRYVDEYLELLTRTKNASDV